MAARLHGRGATVAPAFERRYPHGWLRYVWAIAPVHRLHHRRTAAEGNVNFGLFTTLWDVALGTACFHPAPPVRAGDLGIADAPDFPQRYLEQLAAPFRRGG